MAGKRGRSVYGSKRWRRLRVTALDRDRWRCSSCGRAGALEIHHKTAVAKGGAIWALDNLEAKCRGCHFLVHAAATLPRDVFAWRTLPCT